MTKVIIFDTETTGLPKKRNQNALHEPNCWPDIVSVSWSVFSNVKTATGSSDESLGLI